MGRPRAWAFRFGLLATCLAIGLRFQVGADWQAYELQFEAARNTGLSRLLATGDPGYQLLNWAVQQVGGGFWLVNLLCAAAFTWGLNRFARVQPDPWLTVLIAIPYLVTVVAMGYTRQSVAIAFILAGLAAMDRGASQLRFALAIAAAAMFHKTAVLVLPLAIVAGPRIRVLNALAAIACAVVLYWFFLASSVEDFFRNYVDTSYASEGATVRLAMGAAAAALFLVLPAGLGFTAQLRRLYLPFSLASLAALASLIFLASSTAVDRLALYLLPLQLAVLPRVQFLLRRRQAGRLFVILYCFAVQYVWLTYAAHADYWIPYRAHPLP